MEILKFGFDYVGYGGDLEVNADGMKQMVLKYNRELQGCRGELWTETSGPLQTPTLLQLKHKATMVGKSSCIRSVCCEESIWMSFQKFV